MKKKSKSGTRKSQEVVAWLSRTKERNVKREGAGERTLPCTEKGKPATGSGKKGWRGEGEKPKMTEHMWTGDVIKLNVADEWKPYGSRTPKKEPCGRDLPLGGKKKKTGAGQGGGFVALVSFI